MEGVKQDLTAIINKEKIYNILICGCGGVSMYSIALYLKNLGHRVVGSDVQKSDYTKLLEKNGIDVYYHQHKDNLKNIDIVIYSYAVQNGEEVNYALKLGIKCFSRTEVLGEILKQYKTSICVAGAHGKTTTTALIYTILKNAEYKVDLHLGGNLSNNIECNALSLTNKDYIVCEACEYKDAFLNLKPNIAVITNIAKEHLDYFKNFENIKKSFNKFSKDAQVLICSNLHTFENKNKIFFDKNNKKWQKNINFLKKKENKYDLPEFYADNLTMQKDGTYRFKCYKNNKIYGTFNINLIGKYNVKNALCAIIVADYLGIDKSIIKKSLCEFCGVQRRFEILNKDKFIVCDYAHHPEEISSILNEIKKFYKNKLLVVFQPHTYSRTKNLMNEFVGCFKEFEDVVIYKTYSARESYDKNGSAKVLASNIGEKANYFASKTKMAKFIKQKINLGYGVLFLGAGDIYEIAKNVNKLC